METIIEFAQPLWKTEEFTDYDVTDPDWERYAKRFNVRLKEQCVGFPHCDDDRQFLMAETTNDMAIIVFADHAELMQSDDYQDFICSCIAPYFP